MIVWGGWNGSNSFNTGGRYNPGTDGWTATSTTNAPAARYDHTAVWTGNEMIVWGGRNAGNYFNTGGKYNPSTDNWAATSTTNAPGARFSHTAVWTGSDMIVWGGTDVRKQFNTGGRYNPGTDNWTATTTSNAPERRAYHTAVWSGSEMLVWGGLNDLGPFFLEHRRAILRATQPYTYTYTNTNSYSNIDAYAESKTYTCHKSPPYTASAPVIWSMKKKCIAQSGFFPLRVSFTLLLWAVASSDSWHDGAGLLPCRSTEEIL